MRRADHVEGKLQPEGWKCVWKKWKQYESTVCIIAQTTRKRQESVGPHWEGL